MAINREDWVRSVVPSGTVIAFAGATPPTGWLLCNGSTISRTAYPALFTAISVAHGSGDGSTTFHLPDYQGRFLRGVANGSTNDPDKLTRIAAAAGGNTGNAVGSVQGHANESHTHTIGLNEAFDHNVGQNSTAGQGNLTQRAYSNSTSPSGGNESRPKNANVNYIIKA